jgi:preprotein translocase subunit SecG
MAPLLGSFQGVVLGWALAFLSIFLILLILVQRGRGGGLTGALGGPGGQSAFGTKAGDMFTKITSFTALGWIFLCAYTMWLLGAPAPVAPEDPSPAISASSEADDASEGADALNDLRTGGTTDGGADLENALEGLTAPGTEMETETPAPEESGTESPTGETSEGEAETPAAETTPPAAEPTEPAAEGEAAEGETAAANDAS